jgi:uncharacterized protein YbjT (DUF2867 family)
LRQLRPQQFYRIVELECGNLFRRPVRSNDVQRRRKEVRVLLTGATGLIGSAVLARLREAGHEVIAVSRGSGSASLRSLASHIVRINISQATDAEDWLPHLKQVDAVVNCAGILQDSPGQSSAGVHDAGVAALFRACSQAGVRRVVHISAIGVDRGAQSEFSRSKLAGDEKLMALDLDWVILRPSVVVGRPAYGGSALFRALAALPVLPVPQKTGQLQVVQLDELVQTIIFFLGADAPSRQALEIAGPDRLTFPEVIAVYRQWLGWSRAHIIELPEWIAARVYRLGDFAGWLGWRAPIRSTAQREIARGAVGDATEWTRLTGIEPRSLRSALAAEPASVQERWFAQLYLLKPVLFTVLSVFWIGTGIVSLGPGWRIGVGLMQQGGAGGLSEMSVIAGALADVAIGIGIAFRRTARLALYAALAISVFYLIAGTAILPILWAEPLGPMLKIWPILVLHLVALGILADR